MLSTTIKDHQGSWEDHVQAVCLAYNTSVQPTTGYTPFYLMFGRQARVPIDIMFGDSPVVTSSPSVYATKLQQSLTTAYDQVRNKMDATFQRQKQFYDQKVHGRPFTVGDLVWLYSPVVPTGQAKKLYHPWTGPYEVVKKNYLMLHIVLCIPSRNDRDLLSILIGLKCVHQEQDYHCQLSCLVLLKSNRLIHLHNHLALIYS